MKRRTFLKASAAAAAASPIVLGGTPLRADSSLAALAQLPVDNDRILIVIQLFGGNDGLNTVIPALDDEYYRLRPAIGIPKADAWNKVGDIFLNPALALGSQGGIARMLEIGTLSIVQSVGYPNPNLSHFRSTDIWLSGLNSSDPNVRLDTGWIGRYLEKRYPDFPASLPEHPLAIQFGGFSLALLGSKGRMGIEVTNPDLQRGFSPQLDALDPDSAGTPYEMEYAFVADIASRSNRYAQSVRDAYTNGKAKLRATYGTDGFSKQMASAAALIAGGLNTKVYVVSMGGFDTHVTQQIAPLSGAHPTLLSRLSDGIAQFMNDMIRLDLADRVVGLTVSEFGRRPGENGSFGTDHGAASCQFVFGTMVNSGVFGPAPDLKNLNANGDLSFQIDYREVYGEILTDWFGMSGSEMREVLQHDTLQPLDILQSPGSSRTANAMASLEATAIVGSYPEPFASTAMLDLVVARPEHVTIDISRIDGSRVATILDRRLVPGRHQVPITLDLPSGTYVCTLRSGTTRSSRLVRSVR